MGRALPVLAALAAAAVAVMFIDAIPLLALAAALSYSVLVLRAGNARRMLLTGLMLAVPILILNTVFVPRGETAFLDHVLEFPLGGMIVSLRWRMTLDGALFGVRMALRLTAVIWLFFLASRSLVPEVVFDSVPSRTTLLIAVAARFLPVLEEDARKSTEAQMARGLYRPAGFRGRLVGARYIMFPLLSRSSARCGDLAEAYTLKGLHRPGILPSRTQGSIIIMSSLAVAGAVLTWIAPGGALEWAAMLFTLVAALAVLGGGAP